MNRNDGGPAFPIQVSNSLEMNHPDMGMWIRDAAALAALPAAIQLAMQFNCKEASPAPTAARFAYELADAMIAEREK